MAKITTASLGLLAGKPTASLWTPDYATRGTPVEQQAKALEQQAFIRKKVFDPQYQRALGFALDTYAPERQAQTAGQQAVQANALTRDQFLRLQQQSGAAMTPAAREQSDKEFGLAAARSTADASNMARQSTQDMQTDQLGDLTGMGIGVARQALGLSANAASAYQSRMNQQQQAKDAQAAASAQQTQMAISTTMAIAMAAAVA